MDNGIDLKNCKGCGYEAEFRESKPPYIIIWCPNCGVSVTEPNELSEAVKNWNIINMEYDELALYSIKRLKQESEMFRNTARSLLK